MYFRSMRRQIFLLCCEYSVPFIILWMNSDVKVACQRNEYRNQHENGNVSDESFHRIVTGFESPVDSNHLFDKYCIEINGNLPLTLEWYVI
jgi:tRNA uridine 5-carbamoylmethylation protein Kti12